MTTIDQASGDELRAVVRELTDRWRADGRYRPRSDSWLRSLDVEFSKELASAGIIGMTWPREYGGGDFSNTDRLAVTEELLRAGAPVAAHWIADRQIGPAILRHGTPELRREILPGIVSADHFFCLGMSESEAGSDLAAVRTTATAAEGGWVLRGRKMWTTGAHVATHVYVLARTSPGERKHQGLSEFVVDMNTEGIGVSPIVDMAGEHHFNEVTFDDVFVPHGRLLGKEGDGWQQVIEQLSFERGGPERILSTYPLLMEVLAHGDVIRERHDQDRLGEFVARLAALRTLALEVATQLDNGSAPIQLAATLKYLGNAFERDVVEFSRQILGSSGPRSPFGEALLASPGFSLRGGAADVLLSIIVRQERVSGNDGARPREDGSAPHDQELADLVASLSELTEAQRWEQVCQLGLIGIGVDEKDGGSGGTLEDLVTVVGAFGAHGVSSPLIEASVARAILAECGRLDLLADESHYATLAFVSSEVLEPGAVVPGVPYARDAAVILLVDDRGEVVAVQPARGDARVESGDNVANEPRDRVTLTEVPGRDLIGTVDVDRFRARTALLWSAAICGAVEATYELTRDYVKTREQFGAPLLKIPAVAAQLATMKTHLLLARSTVRRAAAIYGAAGSSPPEQLAAAAVARITTAAAADVAATIGHQLHGAIGITAEYSLHRFTLRLWAWRDTDLAARQWASLLGEQALAGGEALVWSALTTPAIRPSNEIDARDR